jgi:hypothetical protein
MSEPKSLPFLSLVNLEARSPASREARSRKTTERAFAIAQEEKSARDEKVSRLRELRMAQKDTRS